MKISRLFNFLKFLSMIINQATKNSCFCFIHFRSSEVENLNKIMTKYHDQYTRTSIGSHFDFFVLSQIMFKHPLCPLFIARSIEFIFVFLLLIMGLIYSEIELNTKQYTDGMSFPQNLEQFYMDPKKIGNVYVVVFKHDFLHQKLAHHALIVDVAGSSTDSHICGATIHLTAKASTKITEFQIHDRSFRREDFHEIIYIGRLHPPQYSPWFWAYDIQREVKMHFFDSIYSNKRNVLFNSRDYNYF
jgi:hypothetical protein